MLDETARGVYVIAVTPFTDEGALDLTSIDRMVDQYEALLNDLRGSHARSIVSA